MQNLVTRQSPEKRRYLPHRGLLDQDTWASLKRVRNCRERLVFHPVEFMDTHYVRACFRFLDDSPARGDCDLAGNARW